MTLVKACRHTEVVPCTCCRWAKLEDERVQAEAQKKAEAEQRVNFTPGRTSRAEAQTYLEGLASRNQIFNVKEAYTMLSRELSNMMKDRVRWSLHSVSTPYQANVVLTLCSSGPGKILLPLVSRGRTLIASILLAEPPMGDGCCEE